MTKEKYKKLNNLLGAILKSPRSNFYLDHFRKHHYNLSTIDCTGDLSRIPLLHWGDLYNCSYNKRLYKDKKLLVKIVYNANAPLLIARTLEDIAKENYGINCKRPLVLFEYLHETFEKGAWFYENNILPLPSEHDPTLTAMLAKRYLIDGILGELTALYELIPELEEYYDLSRIATLGIITRENVNVVHLREHFPKAVFKITLGLPEVGTIAKVCPESLLEEAASHNSSFIFHSDPTCVVEPGESLIVTRLIFLPTPIIRYQTGIPSQLIQKTCACDAEISFVLV